MSLQPTSEQKAFYNAARTINPDFSTWSEMLAELKSNYPGQEEAALEDLLAEIQFSFPFFESGPAECGGEKADDILLIYESEDITMTEAARRCGLARRVNWEGMNYYF